jgi:hypothetical protein
MPSTCARIGKLNSNVKGFQYLPKSMKMPELCPIKRLSFSLYLSLNDCTLFGNSTAKYLARAASVNFTMKNVASTRFGSIDGSFRRLKGYRVLPLDEQAFPLFTSLESFNSVSNG